MIIFFWYILFVFLFIRQVKKDNKAFMELQKKIMKGF
jgi:preprotein translocase subunit YajC